MNQFNTSKYMSVCTKMLNWLKENDWHSYDPYDAGLSPIARFLPKKGWWVLQHMTRLSPVNIRPLLFVNKQIHSKGLAHVMQACLILNKIRKEVHILQTARQLAEKIVELAVWDNGKCCWNYPFPYITRVLSVRGSTNIVNTSFVALALLDAYEEFNKPIYLDVACRSAKYIINNIGYYSYSNDRICFYYAPKAPKTLTIHNANLIAASLFHRLGEIRNNAEFKQLAYAAALYSIDHQQHNGLWHYSERPGWKSIDCLHNGFILDALMVISTSECTEPFFSSLKNGMAGFRHFLNADGSISHMLNHSYPKDIRSYAQFIQTASLWSVHDVEWLQFAAIGASNAIRTMFSARGYCYYRRYRGIVIKTPFIRWSMGPMLLALAKFIERSRVNHD